MKMTCWTLAIIVLALPAAALARACADLADPDERLGCYDDLAHCVTVHDADDRLACYDEAQASRQSPSDRAEAPAAEPRRPSAPAADEPFPLPRDAEKRDESATLVARIVEVNEGPHGYSYLTLDNGQVWRELSSARVRFEEGDEVELSKGVFGSVNLRVAGRTGFVKVRRVQ